MPKERVMHLLSTSYQDYTRYKEEKDIDYFRDAAEKLFTASQNYLEYKHDEFIGSYEDFKHELNESKMEKEDKRMIKQDANALHVFARHGIIEPYTEDELKEDYDELYAKLQYLLTEG
jgi:hypothetical protein